MKNAPALLIVALALLLMPLAAFATTPSVIYACVNPGNGDLRLVDITTLCHVNEVRVQWNVEGPQGPPGPAGPQGPAGPAGTSAGGGPPFIWVCTPANYTNAGSTNALVHVFNASASTANVAVHFLNKNGGNLAGVTVPGGLVANPGDPIPVYPGQTGATTVPVAPSNTLIVKWITGQGDPDSNTNIPTTISVTSDQPIAVGSNTTFSGFNVVPCVYAHP